MMIGREGRVVKQAALGAVILIVSLAACKGKPKAPPVAAAPVVVAAAAEPLSAPQVIDPLPPPQPIPPEAIPPEQEAPVVEQPPPQPAPTPPRSKSAAPSVGTPPASSGPPAAPPSQPNRGATGQTGAAPLRPMLTPGREKDLQGQIDRSLAVAEKFLAQVGSKSTHKEAAQRIQALVDQARQTRQRGDLNMARSLAERAEVLASDLARSAK